MSSEEYGVVELFYLPYKHGDYLGLFFILTALVPYFVVCSHVTYVVLKRELYSIFLLIGVFLNEAMNMALKRIIKEPRPLGSFKSGYGMPSDHSQFVFYYALILTFSIWSHHKLKTRYIPIGLTMLLFISSCLVAYGRVHVGVHTYEQIFYGSFIGITFGVGWISLGALATSKLIFARLEDSYIAKWFYLRDATHISHPWEFEYLMYMKKHQ